MTEWVPIEVDDRPECGPACPGPETHSWRLSIEMGQASISSGCPECDLQMDPGFDLGLEVVGRMEVWQDHPNLGGWHGDVRCDCNWGWNFIPTQLSEEGAS